MAGEPRNLKVSLSPATLKSLGEIWDWNARQYGAAHADGYSAFLLEETGRLGTAYIRGRPVPTVPGLSFIVIRHRRGGHGHLAVYEVIGDEVVVLQFYHTAQDWQTRVAEEFGQQNDG
jgi:plasmid stabilization system protein ParE